MVGGLDALFDKALITGADGMIGSYADFGIRTTHRTLDVTNRAAVREFCVSHQPKLVIHLAAATDLAQCERDPDYAYRVNTVGTYNLACAAREVGAKFVYVSTSSVFDGKKEAPYMPDDTPNPVNEYGHSKYLGEVIVSAIVPDHLTVRVTWVFGGGKAKDQKFVAKILKQIDQPVIKIIAGKRGSPTYGKDVVRCITRLVSEGKSGVFHIPNSGTATRAEIAREIIRITSAEAIIEEVPESFFESAYQSGNNESLASLPGYMRPWQEALREYITEEWPDVIKNKIWSITLTGQRVVFAKEKTS